MTLENNYLEWLCDDNKAELTAGGNRKPVSRGEYAKWVIEATNGISKETLAKCFLKAGYVLHLLVDVHHPKYTIHKYINNIFRFLSL